MNFFSCRFLCRLKLLPWVWFAQLFSIAPYPRAILLLLFSVEYFVHLFQQMSAWKDTQHKRLSVRIPGLHFITLFSASCIYFFPNILQLVFYAHYYLSLPLLFSIIENVKRSIISIFCCKYRSIAIVLDISLLEFCSPFLQN